MDSISKATQTITIGSLTIRQDAEGRYCLNDLHKAAGGQTKHQPSFWMRTKTFEGLLDELVGSAYMQNLPVSIVKGRYTQQGTFVVKPLVYAYAMWISAAFNLEVINAYDQMVTA